MPLSKQDIIVFLGPSLPRQLANDILLADYRPPAGQGDIYQAIQEQPKVIALIDGLFENQPAVWHKEILYALSKGIHVYGASSMGALRACELNRYGMEGVGWIYEAFINQHLTDDDEVTITHAPEELGFQPTSEAMVNIRLSLEAAEKANIIDSQTTQTLITQSKARWYPQRHWKAVLQDAETLLSPSELSALNDFLGEQRIDIKQQDANALLTKLSRIRQQETFPPKQATFDFVHTDAWQALVEYSEAKATAANTELQNLQQELALQGNYDDYLIQAKSALATQSLGATYTQAHPELLNDALHQFTQTIQATHDNHQPNLEKVQQWLQQHEMTMAEFDAFMQRQAAQLAGEKQQQHCSKQLIDIARLNGDFLTLTQRASHKQQLLRAMGLDKIQLEDTHLSTTQLIDWYFCDYRQINKPSSVEEYLSRQGFADTHQFIQILLQEYLYLAALQERKL